METGKKWSGADPSELETYQQLGEREQKAVLMALRGIKTWQETRVQPKPMRISISSEKPFDLRSFANVLHEMRINIGDSLQKSEDGAVTFQPRPYSKTFMPKSNWDSLDALRETIEEQLRDFPKDWLDLMKRF